MKRLWLTGYRSYELGIFRENDQKVTVLKKILRKILIAELEDNDLEWLITGGNLGIEQWAIQVGIALKASYPLKIALITPYDQFEKNWKEDKQAQFIQLKNSVDFYATVSNQPYQNFTQLKNYERFMIGHTDAATMIYDLENIGKPQYDYEAIIKESEIRDYPLNLIDFYALDEAATEIQESENDFFE